MPAQVMRRPSLAAAPARPAAAAASRPTAPAGSPTRAGPFARPAPARPAPSKGNGKPAGGESQHEILFQKYFKSVNPQRTYAAQVKRANNDNHYLILTEGRRDDATGEVRKTRLFIYSEDFPEFFRMLQETAHFVRANPVPEEVKKKRRQYWAKKEREAKTAPEPAARPPAASNGASHPSQKIHEGTKARSR